MLRGACGTGFANRAQVASLRMASPGIVQPAGSPPALGPLDRTEAWRWLLYAAVGLLVGYVAVVLFTNLGAAIAGTKGGVTALAAAAEPPSWYVAAGLVGIWCGFLVPVFVARRAGRRLGLVVARWDSLYVFLGLVLQLVIAVAYIPVHVSGGSNAVNQQLGGGAGWVLVIPAILTIVGALLVEELFFRGVLLRALLVLCRGGTAVLGTAVAVAVDATLFGLAHLGSGDQLVQLPGLAAVGAVLAWLAVKTGRLGPSIVTHASFNAVAVLYYSVQH